MTSLFATVLAWALSAAPPTEGRKDERMEVEDVLNAGDGQFVVVLRTQGRPLRYLPIWVGEMEAVAIRMRLDRQEPPRPMTLNLLEQVLRAANIRITQIAIDDYKGGVFLGRIKLRQNNRNWEMEARPSDAIGLAVGRRTPIWVTQAILDGAAIDPRTLRQKPPLPPQATSVDESL